MKNLLYIGNKLHKHGFNKTSIETLGVFLADEGYAIAYTSDKKNQVVRLLDMMMTTFFKAKNSHLNLTLNIFQFFMVEIYLIV